MIEKNIKIVDDFKCTIPDPFPEVKKDFIEFLIGLEEKKILKDVNYLLVQQWFPYYYQIN